MRKEPLRDRFFRKIEINKGNGCWEWTASITWCGYGHIKLFGNKLIMAHRASWIIHNGEIPKGKFVLHKCDNRKCVNPSHLWLGTNKENIIDAHKKGRLWSKLKKEDVDIIRKRYKETNIQQWKLAEEFNVDQGLISKIINNKIWIYG